MKAAARGNVGSKCYKGNKNKFNLLNATDYLMTHYKHEIVQTQKTFEYDEALRASRDTKHVLQNFSFYSICSHKNMEYFVGFESLSFTEKLEHADKEWCMCYCQTVLKRSAVCCLCWSVNLKMLHPATAKLLMSFKGFKTFKLFQSVYAQSKNKIIDYVWVRQW